MTDSTAESSLTTTVSLLTYYSDEGGSQPQTSLLDHWLEHYPPEWVRLALIEAIYRGRYKTVSVGGLLTDWQRRGQPIYHFNREFEALICHNFPRIWFGQDLAVYSEQSLVEPWALKPAQNLEPSTASPQPTSPDTDTLKSQPDAFHPTDRSLRSLEPDIPANLAPKTRPGADPVWTQESGIPPLSAKSPLMEPERYATLSDNQTDQQVQGKGRAKPRGFKVDPIHQFTPNRESSEHYQKLVAMVSKQSKSYGHQAKAITTVAS